MGNKARHIAIIMDGNGRWAEAQGKKRVKGHEKGAEVVRDITTFCSNHKEIERLTLYAFSTENWKRPKYEVDFLMKLLDNWLKKELPIYLKNDIRFKAIGDISGFSKKLQNTIKNVEEKTLTCKGLTQSLALNYGSKNEVIRAVNSLIKENIEVTEASLEYALDTSMPVDILIRSGGDHRLSNFLLWQSAYAELFFTETLWPDFTPNELESILKNFKNIERRFGGLK
ncbi:MAG: di-trans,poly-cis-decaprenylcistransferase [Campylobacterota bacterium]|nr:di-trans,poly-cis-decaprenylcistransferase [Campylobacterota bacterium]